MDRDQDSARPNAGLILYGFSDVAAADRVGPRGRFQGVDVEVVREGPIAAYAVEEAIPDRWSRFIPARLKPHRPMAVQPVLSALATVLPFLPVAPGTRIRTLDELLRLMKGRGGELSKLVAAHASLVECEVTAVFDPAAAEREERAAGPLAHLQAENEAEEELIRIAHRQSAAGRKASLFARLRRRLLDMSEDVLIADGIARPTTKATRRVLIDRRMRGRLKPELEALAADCGMGALISVGTFLPPISFRTLEIRVPEPSAVAAARTSFGLSEVLHPSSLRTAYHRALERAYPTSPEAQRRGQRLRELESQYALLELVAEGQLRIDTGAGDMKVRLDEESIRQTLLMSFHARDRALRAA